ncbi:MAG: DUF2169 domain-containing protein [Polyangiaceae bacterium]
MSEPPVRNDTDFIADPQVLADRDGEKLCAIVKATFELVDGPARGADGTFAIAPKGRRRKLRSADFPWGEPTKSSIMYPTDLCVYKPATDVVVVAVAHAPGGTPVPTFDAGVRVGRVQKVVRITGPRAWVAGGDALTQPRPVRSLEVRYDWAFGGSDLSGDKTIEDARNPVGMGVVGNKSALEAKAGPQIEDPLEPIKDAHGRPKPAGLGAIGRHWEPRRRYWGTYDTKWLEGRAPLPPADFDDRANLCATPELIASPYLVGLEEGALTNLTPGGGTVGFVLPRVRLSIEFLVKGRERETFTPPLDTVLLDTVSVPRPKPKEGEDPATAAKLGPITPLVIELVWRAAVRAPRKLSDAEIIVTEKRA